MGPVTRTLQLDDDRSLADLTTFVRRAARADPDGAARLIGLRTGAATVLAVYVSPVHGGGGPTVLGLRTFGLDRDDGAEDGCAGSGPARLDVVVPLAALTDRLARPELGRELAVPPVELSGVVWAGVSAPRSGWSTVGALPVRELSEMAHRGITEIASGAPDVAGSAAVAALRARVWGRPIGGGAAAVPAGAAFVAHVLGFLPSDSGQESAGTPTKDVVVRAAGSWRRLTTDAGHVLARPPLLGA